MAEGFLKEMLLERLSNSERIQVLSTGLNAYGGRPTGEAIEAVRKEGADISGFESRQLTQEFIERADLILAMKECYKETILLHHPQANHIVFTLKGFAGETSNLGISDPYDKGLKAYETCAKEIIQALGKAFTKFLT